MSNHLNTMLEALKASNTKVYVAAAGAGAGIQKMLWGVPGASKFLAGASFPYSKEAFDEFVGYTPEHYVSRDAAIGLAIAAYLKASTSCSTGQQAVGLGVSAAVTTERERRGGKRIEAVVVTADKVLAVSRTISDADGRLTPAEYRMIDGSAHVDGTGVDLLFHAVLGEPYKLAQDITEEARAHFFGRPLFTRYGQRLKHPTHGDPAQRLALYPGNFNPPHAGHFAVSSEKTLFQVSAAPPHKPVLSLGDMLQRVCYLRGKRDVMFLPGAPLYIDKARLFPHATFILGADAMDRMLDPKWGMDIVPMLQEFVKLGTFFLVAPRGADTMVSVLSRHKKVVEYLHTHQGKGRGLFGHMQETQFKDLSSTQIREQDPTKH